MIKLIPRLAFVIQRSHVYYRNLCCSCLCSNVCIWTWQPARICVMALVVNWAFCHFFPTWVKYSLIRSLKTLLWSPSRQIMYNAASHRQRYRRHEWTPADCGHSRIRSNVICERGFEDGIASNFNRSRNRLLPQILVWQDENRQGLSYRTIGSAHHRISRTVQSCQYPGLLRQAQGPVRGERFRDFQYKWAKWCPFLKVWQGVQRQPGSLREDGGHRGLRGAQGSLQQPRAHVEASNGALVQWVLPVRERIRLEGTDLLSGKWL